MIQGMPKDLLQNYHILMFFKRSRLEVNHKLCTMFGKSKTSSWSVSCIVFSLLLGLFDFEPISKGIPLVGAVRILNCPSQPVHWYHRIRNLPFFQSFKRGNETCYSCKVFRCHVSPLRVTFSQHVAHLYYNKPDPIT